MIPTRGNYVVHFKDRGDLRDGLPVEAWDEDGFPLVLGEQKLVRASSLGAVAGIQRSDPGPVIAALPSGGWRLTTDGGEDVPVFAWLVDNAGWIWPATMEDGASHAWPRDLDGVARPPAVHRE